MESGVEGVLDVASDACHGLKDLGNGLINFVNSHDPVIIHRILCSY